MPVTGASGKGLHPTSVRPGSGQQDGSVGEGFDPLMEAEEQFLCGACTHTHRPKENKDTKWFFFKVLFCFVSKGKQKGAPGLSLSW